MPDRRSPWRRRSDLRGLLDGFPGRTPTRGERAAATVDRIAADPGGVVAVGIAGRQREDPLRDQLFDRVIDLAGLPVIRHAVGQSLDQAQATIRGLHQNRPSVRGRVGLIETGDDGLVEQIVEQKGLSCSRPCAHEASGVMKAWSHLLSNTTGVLSFSELVNFPG